ncbi:MAG: TilS substrate-binding domain-containing protein [Clostridiales Family XIII bacterium]|jgi:tRNA(Ile)-lysidine synthase TilS/MesJ|nr:TilS substrate-binding domain-containing protein [Clostridiales Family XIII bacterium]
MMKRKEGDKKGAVLVLSKRGEKGTVDGVKTNCHCEQSEAIHFVTVPFRLAGGEKPLIDASLIEDGQTIVLGLSGGPDSVCLLYELLALDAARRRDAGRAGNTIAGNNTAGNTIVGNNPAGNTIAGNNPAGNTVGNAIICAHVNHGLRGAESDGDEAFVVGLCGRLGLALELIRIDVAALAKETGMTVEEAGRAARYAFFDEVCEKYGGTKGDGRLCEKPVIARSAATWQSKKDWFARCLYRLLRFARKDSSVFTQSDGSFVLPPGTNEPSPFVLTPGTNEPSPFVPNEPSPFVLPPAIAVAHNKNDLAETVFMRIVRGTGTDGLAGIAPRRKSAAGFDVVRPLLGVSRGEIDSRLEAYGAEARKDGSNLNTEYFRNKIRLDIIPYIEESLEACLTQSLSRLAENAAEDKAYFDAAVTGMLGEYLKGGISAGGSVEGGIGTSSSIGVGSAGGSVVVGADPCVASDAGAAPAGDSPGRGSVSLPLSLLAGAHPAIRHRLIRRVFAELGLRRDIAAVHLAAADRLIAKWQNGGEASGKRVEFPFDYTFGIVGKKAVFRAPGAPRPNWKPRRKL